MNADQVELELRTLPEDQYFGFNCMPKISKYLFLFHRHDSMIITTRIKVTPK